MKKKFELLGQCGLVSFLLVVLWFLTDHNGFLFLALIFASIVPLLIVLFLGEEKADVEGGVKR